MKTLLKRIQFQSLAVFCGTFSLIGAAPLQSAEPGPTAAELTAQAARCRRILQTSIIKFYLPNCVDVANGGYLESLRDGKFSPTGEKVLTLQSRPLRIFRTLARAGMKKRAAVARTT